MNNLNDSLNQDINTVFDTFDHIYGKLSGPNNNPEKFMGYLNDTYSTKYLNLKNTKYLKPEHLEAFLNLKGKELEPYHKNMAVSKVIDVKEPTINLKSEENRKLYIEYLKKIKQDYELLEGLQLGSKDMGYDFNF